MRSSVTVLDEVLLNFYRNNCADCSGFKTIQNLKCLNSLWRFMHLFTKAWWTIPSGRFDFQALITPNLFQSVHRVIDLKIHCIIFLWPVKVAVMFTIFATWKWEKIRPSFPALLTTFLDSICFSAQRSSTFGVRNERHKHWWKWTDLH